MCELVDGGVRCPSGAEPILSRFACSVLVLSLGSFLPQIKFLVSLLLQARRVNDAFKNNKTSTHNYESHCDRIRVCVLVGCVDSVCEAGLWLFSAAPQGFPEEWTLSVHFLLPQCLLMCRKQLLNNWIYFLHLVCLDVFWSATQIAFCILWENPLEAKTGFTQNTMLVYPALIIIIIALYECAFSVISSKVPQFSQFNEQGLWHPVEAFVIKVYSAPFLGSFSPLFYILPECCRCHLFLQILSFFKFSFRDVAALHQIKSHLLKLWRLRGLSFSVKINLRGGW